MRVAYVTPFGCGMGHAVRGAALARAAGGIEFRAFGPPAPREIPGYKGSADWHARVLAFAPDLLIGDLGWMQLDELRSQLGVPAWLLLRWVQCSLLKSHGQWQLDRWERRISIEPAADGLPMVTDSIPPIVVADRGDPVPAWLIEAGYKSRAGTNAYWESVWLGYRDLVEWQVPEPNTHLDEVERVRVGGEMTANGAGVLMDSVRASTMSLPYSVALDSPIRQPPTIASRAPIPAT